MESLTFWLSTEDARQRAVATLQGLPVGIGLKVEVTEERRTLSQNDRLHALLADIVKARPHWAGERMDVDDYKALMVHAMDKHEGRDAGRAVPGVEGGVVLLRRSTKRMSKRDLSMLIQYIEATMTKWGIPVKDVHHAA